MGQIRQTIDALLSDIQAMKCGELIRLINHIGRRMKKDAQRCIKERKKYINELKIAGDLDLNAATGIDVSPYPLDEESEMGSTQNSTRSVRLLTVSKAEKKRQRNPSLKFQHIHGVTWNNFIRNIARSFYHNIKSKEIKDKLKQNEEKSNDEQAEPEQGDNDEDNDKDDKQKTIFDIILENTQFDIINKSGIDNNGFGDKFNVSSDDVIAEDKEMEFKYQDEAEDEKTKKLKRARFDVFDTILSFSSKRITLQQLFAFARQFKAFLKNKGLKKINKMMVKYDNNIKDNQAVDFDELRKTRIPNNFEIFKNEYFSGFKDNKKGKLKDYLAEIEWLHLETETAYDLCRRIYPFWGSVNNFIHSIYNFMESTEQIQGIYELKCAEFGQLKYSLNVNDDLANKLFHIIRFKHRSLSWKQLYSYLLFILKMKYNVQKAILKSKQAEDTTVSEDGMKILLKISLNDESNWLFNRVLFLNGSKVTWKQIRNYLTKMLAVRQDMRDFFDDRERDRNYDENKAEIIDEISKTVEDNNTNNQYKNQDIMELLKTIKKQNESMKKEIDALKQKLG